MSNDVTQNVMAAFMSQDQRGYINIRRKKSAIEIFEALQESCGTGALLYEMGI